MVRSARGRGAYDPEVSAAVLALYRTFAAAMPDAFGDRAEALTTSRSVVVEASTLARAGVHGFPPDSRWLLHGDGRVEPYEP